MKHRAAAIGLAVGLAAGGAAGVAIGVPALSGAQDTTTSVDAQAPATPAPSQDPAAPQDRDTYLQDTLKPLVDNGTITQDQADAVIGALKEARPPHGPGDEHGMRGGPGLDAAATALGMTPEDLGTALRSGQTLAQIAQGKGVDPQTVIDAMVADLKTHLDQEVASGEHTQAEADQKLADATQRITDMVNNGMPAGGPPMGPGMGRHFGPPPADDDNGSTTTPTTA